MRESTKDTRASFPFVLLFLAAALVASGCDSGGGEDRPDCSQNDVLMPLCSGNAWRYQAEGEDDQGPALSLEVLGRIERDGVTWTIVGEESSGTQSAIRNTDDGTYFAEYHYDTDDLDRADTYFRFPAEDGATYTFANTETTVTRETVTVPAGSFDAYTYVFENEAEGGRVLSLAPGVGIVRLQTDGAPLELASRTFE